MLHPDAEEAAKLVHDVERQEIRWWEGRQWTDESSDFSLPPYQWKYR
jgi:hypothetical protein